MRLKRAGNKLTDAVDWRRRARAPVAYNVSMQPALRTLMSIALITCGCAAPRGVRTDALAARLDAAANAAIERNQIAGAVIIAGRGPAILHAKAYGLRQAAPDAWREPMTLDTVFDLASLTKVAATATALAFLIEEGRVALDDPVARFLPDWPEKELTLRHLATHTSGFAAYLDAGEIARTYPGVEPCDAIYRAIAAHARKYPRGTDTIYSCLNYELLGRTLEAAAGEDLEQYLVGKVWQVLGMADTRFRLSPAQGARAAPTEGGLRGVVHDPLARFYGTGAHLPGNAGLFSTGPDLARFTAMLACRGTFDGRVVMRPATVELLFANQAPAASNSARGLGWVIDNEDVYQPAPGARRVRTHGGFTGTFLWIDPPSGAFLVVLSSRLHVFGTKGDVFPLRREAARIVCEEAAAPADRAP
jgi:CubicO group peptidase (beta-lactamase class C family)